MCDGMLVIGQNCNLTRGKKTGVEGKQRKGKTGSVLGNCAPVTAAEGMEGRRRGKPRRRGRGGLTSIFLRIRKVVGGIWGEEEIKVGSG